MKRDLRYHIWYHKVFEKNVGPARVLEKYGNIEAFYEAVISGKEKASATPKRLEQAKKFSLIDADRVISVCERNGWEIIPRESEFFPQFLRETSDCPRILFVHGKKEVLTRRATVAVVGSRSLSPRAEALTRNASYNIAKAGAVIVSGAALGADSAAHRGAIEANGETVAVLGCGLGSSYMQRIGSLYDEILAHGVFVTELFPFEDANTFTFPERNRIISGISRAVLVSYAEQKSGSLITAELAKKQKRRVYAMASELYHSDGCAELISGGACVFYNAGDICYPLREFFEEGTFREDYCNRPVTEGISELSDEKPAKKKKESSKSSEKKSLSEKTDVPEKTEIARKNESETVSGAPTELPGHFSEDAKKIYLSLENAGIVPINSFVDTLGIPAGRLMSAVFELSLAGFAELINGTKVRRLR